MIIAALNTKNGCTSHNLENERAIEWGERTNNYIPKQSNCILSEINQSKLFAYTHTHLRIRSRTPSLSHRTNCDSTDLVNLLRLIAIGINNDLKFHMKIPSQCLFFRLFFSSHYFSFTIVIIIIIKCFICFYLLFLFISFTAVVVVYFANKNRFWLLHGSEIHAYTKFKLKSLSCLNYRVSECVSAGTTVSVYILPLLFLIRVSVCW